MKLRKQGYGSVNLVGKNIERIRKQQGIKQQDFISRILAEGLDINPSSYSKLEGQVRQATDRELFVIAKLLRVSIDALFE